MENIKETLQILKSDIAELKKLFDGDENKIARFENMEKVIADFEADSENEIASKNDDEDFRKAVEDFNKKSGN